MTLHRALSPAGGRRALLVLAALLAVSCHPRISDPHDPQFVVAEAGDWTITRGQLDKNIAGFLQQRQVTAAQVGAARLPMLETKVLRDMVVEKLLLARAATLQFKDLDQAEAAALARLKGRFPTEQAFQDQLKKIGVTEEELKSRIHDGVLEEKTLEAEAIHDVDPTDKEVDDFYLSHQSIFDVPLKLRASRVLVIVNENATSTEKAAKKKTIDQAHARVLKGEDLSKVAMEVSEDRYSAPKGGDIGYFQRGENEAQFDDVAFTSKLGSLSPVFETPMGYQFIKVTEIKPAGTLPIDDARAPIVDELRRLKVTSEKNAYSQKLLKDSNVKYYITMVDLPPPPPPATSVIPAQNGADGSVSPRPEPPSTAAGPPSGH